MMRNKRRTSRTASTVAISIALLSTACFHDTSTPPDTTPPTVVITDNVSASKTTSDSNVVFTFAFSEPIRRDFNASKITITGGTAESFVRSSETVSSLVVAPTPDVEGTIRVSLPPGAFQDHAGNENTLPASASQEYSSGITGAPYTLTVNVSQGHAAFASPLEGSSVSVDGVTKVTSAAGTASFHVADGLHSIGVEKAGYAPASASSTIAGADKSAAITMALSRPPSTTSDTWTPGSGWTLHWSDEFDAPTLKTSNWSFQELEAGSYNNELQTYTNSQDNCFITNRNDADGMMVIKAAHVADGIEPGHYTSARMITHEHVDFKYGKVAARIQVPYGQGVWPAFWMMGSNIDQNPGGTVPWPQCGEIDIMEMFGGGEKEKELKGTVHYWTDQWIYQTHSLLMTSGLPEDFHVYELEWSSDSLIWRFDGTTYFTVDISNNADFSEFDENFYILLNIAIGGTQSGLPDSTTVFPQYMFVDWVRIYQ